jgi:sulfatase modifying factor 1
VRGVCVGALVAVAACQALAGIDDYVIGDCKGGPCAKDAGLDNAVTETGAIPAVDSGRPCLGQPPAAVRVGSPGNTFCIDSTEVTNAQYQAFLAAAVPLASQDPKCAWNASFQPEEYDAGPAPGPSHPQVGVDWCDAVAYCRWAGKYLCGKVENGAKVGPVTSDGLGDFRSHQWLLACSAEGRRDYPYGAPFSGSKCNIANFDAGFALPVAEAGACLGGYEGIHDMLGNVWEWYDGPCREDGSLEVDGGDGGHQSDSCMLKGASFTERGGGFDCRFDLPNIRRDSRGYTIGFRCCSD